MTESPVGKVGLNFPRGWREWSSPKMLRAPRRVDTFSCGHMRLGKNLLRGHKDKRIFQVSFFFFSKELSSYLSQLL